MSNIYFTSDTHFFHTNILKYCPDRATRWSTVTEMNEGLIERWNDTVSPNADVYHLGDLSFGTPDNTLSVLERLHGRIHFVSGNHDQVVHNNSTIRSRFASVRDYFELRHSNHKIVMFHFPMVTWNKSHHGSIHVHGHCHNSLPQSGGKRFDVGVDSTQITGTAEHRPFSIKEVIKAAERVQIEVVDHHTPSTPR